MRIIDDKIVYAINQSIPTASFKGQSDAIQNCKELHQTVSDSKIQRIYLYTKYSDSMVKIVTWFHQKLVFLPLD